MPTRRSVKARVAFGPKGTAVNNANYSILFCHVIIIIKGM